MEIIHAPIVRNYTPGRQGREPRGIIVHTYNGKGTSLQNWFNNIIAQVSATASVIDTGAIYVYLDDMDTAWANGSWDANLDFLSLEHWDNGNPNDSVRTDALYEAAAQWCASKYIKWNWNISDSGLIKPHKEYAATGCPGQLDINRIRVRTYEILHPEPVIPGWKKEAQDLGSRTFKPERDVALMDFVKGETVKTFPAYTEITVKYLSQGYYITQSSFDGNRPTGFKKEDLEYVMPKPDVIEYYVSNTESWEAHNFDPFKIIYCDDLITARIFFEEQKEKLKPGEFAYLVEYNRTQHKFKTFDKHYRPNEVVYYKIEYNEEVGRFESYESAIEAFDGITLRIKQGEAVYLYEITEVEGAETISKLSKKFEVPVIPNQNIIKWFINFLRHIYEKSRREN